MTDSKLDCFELFISHFLENEIYMQEGYMTHKKGHSHKHEYFYILHRMIKENCYKTLLSV